MESCVRGHHIYKDVWSPSLGKVLQCTCKLENTKDRYAVAVVRRSTVVGHIPRKNVLSKERNRCCEVTGTRCYSEDLPQGGLEISYKLTFNHRADSASRAQLKFNIGGLKFGDPWKKISNLPN